MRVNETIAMIQIKRSLGINRNYLDFVRNNVQIRFKQEILPRHFLDLAKQPPRHRKNVSHTDYFNKKIHD